MRPKSSYPEIVRCYDCGDGAIRVSKDLEDKTAGACVKPSQIFLKESFDITMMLRFFPGKKN